MQEDVAEHRYTYLGVIDAEFRRLYGVGSAEAFDMEIEYKITRDGILAIKQARPWHSDGVEVPLPTASPSPTNVVTVTPAQRPTATPTAPGPATPGHGANAVFMPYVGQSR